MLRSVLPLLWLALPLAGCFGSHGHASDDTCNCCGTRVARPTGGCGGGLCDPYCRPALDGGTPIDSGPGTTTCECCGVTVEIGPEERCELGICDPYCLPPLRCDPRPIDLACGFGYVPAGAPMALPVQMGGEGTCFCGETISCEVSVIGEGRSIALTTGMCSDAPLCDACFPFIEGVCELPPLDEGRWQVNINGNPGFELDVGPADALPEWGLTCLTAGDVDPACGTHWPTFPHSTGRICHPIGAMSGERFPVRIVDDCAGCEEVRGPCQVDVFDSIIRVRPTELGIGCDVDCPAICMLREDLCWIPPLPAGTWELIVDTLPSHRGTIIVTDPGAPPPPGETCTVSSP